ncbi:MAG: nucleotidyltransferase domain-containing protein [Prevotellaceae bacterium]|nr:nucleotidyltransferase domain-containing protein [Prevotellaceae bacterium]
MVHAHKIGETIAEYFKTKPVVKAWIFGSFARGEETPQSDVNILVMLDPNKPVGMEFFGMYEDLKEPLGRNVDLVTDRSLASFAHKSVERDRKLVYHS